MPASHPPPPLTRPTAPRGGRRKIAVICALPPNRNTGMATVDLAAHAALPRLVPGHEVELFTFGSPSSYGYQDGDLPYAHTDMLAKPEHFFASDVFLFWGDFIHAHAYWKLDRGAWAGKAAEAGFSNVDAARFIFLSELSADRLRDAIVFGSTIITNTAEDQADAGYARQFDRLFSGAGAVLLRDALSASRVSPLRGGEATLGCDAAFLLHDDDLMLLDGFTPPTRRGGVGVFVGRSPGKLPTLALARAIAARLGTTCRWVPWLHTRRLLRVAARPLGYDIPPEQPATGSLLAQLASCRFVVTDTYHVCVNAWRLGIPAICIGAGAARMDTSLSDKKKEILYEMLGARSLYVFAEHIASPLSWSAKAGQLAALLSDSTYLDAVHSAVRAQTRSAEARLQAALQRCIERRGAPVPAAVGGQFQR